MSLVTQQENRTCDSPKTPVSSTSLSRNSASLELNIFTREWRGAALSCQLRFGCHMELTSHEGRAMAGYHLRLMASAVGRLKKKNKREVDLFSLKHLPFMHRSLSVSAPLCPNKLINLGILSPSVEGWKQCKCLGRKPRNKRKIFRSLSLDSLKPLFGDIKKSQQMPSPDGGVVIHFSKVL